MVGVTLCRHTDSSTGDFQRWLREMLDEAVRYVTSFGWCRLIVDSYFGLGVGGVVGVFLFRIESAGKRMPTNGCG
jgi:hypothetical protein